MNHDSQNEFKGKKAMAAIMLWALLFHGCFSFLNFVDPRSRGGPVFGFNVMLHLFFGPLVVMAFC